MVFKYIETLLNTQLCTRTVIQSHIGVVSPYKLQCDTISARCRKNSLEDITIGSAEIFQGQEKPIMIVSTVCVDKLTDFAKNDRVRCSLFLGH